MSQWDPTATQEQPRPGRGSNRRNRRSGRKLVIGLLIMVLILLAVLVVVDRVSVGVANGIVARQVSDQVGGRNPKASIRGFPFLTQVAGGHYQHIDISASSVPLTQGFKADSISVSLRRVNLSFSQLRARDLTGSRAQTATATARLPVTGLAGALGLSASITANGNKLGLTLPLTVLGREVSARAQATLSAQAGRLKLSVTSVTVGGVAGGDAVRQAVQRKVNGQLGTVPKLPYGLKLNAASISGGKLALSATGHDVPLSRR